MRTVRIAAVFMMGLLLLTPAACGGGGGGGQPTPTATYIPPTSEGEPSTQLYEEAPVYLIIVDPDGLIVSGDKNEIPGAIYGQYDTDGDGRIDSSVWSPERKEGIYTAWIIPKEWALPSDTFNLVVSPMTGAFGYTDIYLAKDVFIRDIPDEPYTFEFKERITTNTTYTGEQICNYRDTVDLGAVLIDDNGHPLSNKTVTFQIGFQMVAAVTDSNGEAVASLCLSQEPGDYYYVEAEFRGDIDYAPSYDNTWFMVEPASEDIDELIGGAWVNYSTEDVFADNWVYAISSDKEGNIWFTTANGVVKYDGDSWKTYTTEDGLGSNMVYAVASDNNGNTWFGTAAGVSKFDGEAWTSYTTADGLPFDMVQTIACDNEGNLWLSPESHWSLYSEDTSAGGVCKFDGSNWTTYTTSDGLAYDLVTAIACDNEGNAWFGTPRRLSKFDGANWSIYDRLDGLASNKIYSITVSADDTKWFGTDRGVSKFDGNTWTTYVPPEIECELSLEGKLTGKIDSDIAVDAEGNLWVIIWRSSDEWTTGLIYRFDGIGWTFYTRTDGLNYYFGPLDVAIDADDNVWVSTDTGVYKFEKNP